MKKKYLVMAVAAMFTLAAVTSCDGAKGKKHQGDMEEVEDENKEEMSEEDETEVVEKDDYLTQDLATFDLRGPVVAVKYTADEYMEPVAVQFEDNGSLKSIYKFDVEGAVDEGIVWRDNKNRIERIGFETLNPWETFLTYGSGTMLPKSSMDSNQMGNYTKRTYERDDNGNIVDVEFEEAVHGSVVENHDEYVIKFTDLDSHGNWIRCTFKHGSYSSFLKRTIVYKGEENPYQKEIDEALEGEPAIRQFITYMYENQRYYDREFLEAHCTERLLQYLREQYEYDGDGYAGWLFRTGSQDSKPGAEGTPDKVISIVKDNMGYYHYTFTDGGWRGENKIKAYVEDGKVMMDEVERVSDESDN